MGVWVIGLNLSRLVAILGCLTCMLLLFFESAFGICVGCKIYNAIWPGMAQHCPSGVCEIQRREPIQQIGLGQVASVEGLGVIVALASPHLAGLPALSCRAWAHQRRQTVIAPSPPLQSPSAMKRCGNSTSGAVEARQTLVPVGEKLSDAIMYGGAGVRGKVLRA
jgi:hypothetical protein